MKLSLGIREIEEIRNKLGREPKEEELLIMDSLWSEHCSYKSSKFFLRRFSYLNERVIMGIEDWQDAGAIDVGDGYALVIKVESHNHPSALDPFNGAATGVGGIIRDVISKGAKPIALLDMIRTGRINNQKAKWLAINIVKGISYYGNSIGVPVIGGEFSFDDCYVENPLVNIACLGIVKKDRIVPSFASKPSFLVIAGSTGIDGLGGASFASRQLSGEDEIGAVQIGDAFYGKLLMDSTLEIAEKAIAIKDLGGGGLAVAVSEMVSPKFGAEVNLEKVPLRDPEMKPWEIIVSETQERMLIATDFPEKVCEVYLSNEIPCSVIGKVTERKEIVFKYNGEVIVNLPSEIVTPPIYVRNSSEYFIKYDELPNITAEEAVKLILSSYDFSSMEWAYSQYDYEVGTSTVIKPGERDSSIISLPNGKLIAVKADANPDLCYLDPYNGAKQVFAETYRNLASVGAKMIAAVDHLQFGNPEKEEIFYQFEMSVNGIAEASRFFDVPIVGGKVSFYNEDKHGNPIKPTPLIVGVGLLDNFRRTKKLGEELILIGKTRSGLGGSLLAKELNVKLRPPQVILDEEKRNSDFVIKLIKEGEVTYSKDVSKGGLVGSTIKLSLQISKGVNVDFSNMYYHGNRLESLFSESGGRFLVLTSKGDEVIDLAKSNGIVARKIGEINDEYEINLGGIRLRWEEVKKSWRKLNEVM